MFNADQFCVVKAGNAINVFYIDVVQWVHKLSQIKAKSKTEGLVRVLAVHREGLSNSCVHEAHPVRDRGRSRGQRPACRRYHTTAFVRCHDSCITNPPHPHSAFCPRPESHRPTPPSPTPSDPPDSPGYSPHTHTRSDRPSSPPDRFEGTVQGSASKTAPCISTTPGVLQIHCCGDDISQSTVDVARTPASAHHRRARQTHHYRRLKQRRAASAALRLPPAQRYSGFAG